MKNILVILFVMFSITLANAQTTPATEAGDDYTCYNLDENNMHCYLEDSDDDLDLDNDGILDREYDGFGTRNEDVLDSRDNEGVIDEKDDGLLDNSKDSLDPEFDDEGVLDRRDDGIRDRNPQTQPGDDDSGL